MNKDHAQGAVLLLVLPAIAAVTMLLISSVSLLSTQHQINVNNQVSVMARTDCRNALQITRVWLTETSDTPPTPTIDAAYNVWSQTDDKALVESDEWWQDSIHSLADQNLALMPQVGEVGVHIDHLSGEATDTFRNYQISARCQNNQGGIMAMMQAELTVGHPTQTLLPVMDWQMYNPAE